MLLDLPDRELGEVLVDFGEDPALNVLMDRLAQVREGARWRHNRERGDATRSDKLLEGSSDVLSKAMLLELVPVCRLHPTATVGSGTRKAAPWTIGTLLVCGGVLVAKNTRGSQIWKFLVALIAQEKRLPPVTDQDVGRRCGEW